MSEPTRSTHETESGWPQPPPPPVPLAPPPAPASAPPPVPRDGGAWPLGQGSLSYLPLEPPRRAEGRAAFLALAIGVAITSWILFTTAAVFAARMAALPATIAGTAGLARDSSVLITLAVVLAAATAAAGWAGRQWLDHVRAGTGATSITALLGPVEAPAFGTSRPLPAIRRLATAVVALPGAGLALICFGLASWLTADDPAISRTGLALVLAGASAVILAQGLLPALMRAIERREHLAAPPDRFGRRIALPADRHPIGGVVMALGGLSVVVVAALAVGPIRLADVACAAPDGWRCASITVAAVPGSTDPRPDFVSVGYAVHRAADPGPGDRRVLVIAVGGPGSSGIDEAEWYAASLPDAILDAYDVVLFDARGVGTTDPRECPDAFEDFARDETPSGARQFADGCVREAGVAGLDLSRFGTAAVVEDLEAIRSELGVDRMAVYGASYGTVVAQAYAVAHPDRVTALVLDAPVDRRLDGLELWQTASDGFGDVLDETFRACGEDSTCDWALRDPRAAWNRLVARVDRDGSLTATMPDDLGRATGHVVMGEHLYRAVRSALYEPTGRMLVLRALAAAEAGDDRLLVRLAEASGDPTYWPGAFSYYATWCADSRVSPTERADDLDSFEAAIRARRTDAPGADDVVRTLMPCLYWPAQPALGTDPADPEGIPTLILTATSDPITPDTEAKRLLDGIDGAHLVEVTGGGHVSLGSGFDCVDDPVVDLLLDGSEPARHVTTCDGWVADSFVALTPYGSRPVDAPWSVAVELLNDPAYVYWDGASELVIPCLWAGSARVADRGPDADEVVLDGCSMASGAPPIDGRGTLDWYASEAELDVTLPDGALEFRLGPDGPRATGTWKGRPYSYGS